MRHGSRSLAAVLALLASGSASAVELNYTWKKGDVHRFQYEDDSTIEMKMPGMGADMGGMQMPGMNMGAAGMNVRMKLQSTFSQKVLAVRPDGSAEVELTLEKMALISGDKRVTALDKIPAAAKKVKAEVDRKGHAKFYRMVTVYLQEGRTVVGVPATLTAGDTRVSVVAAVDPKTGSVSLAMDEKKVPPALKAVQVKEEDPSVDVLPKHIFEMMVLPEGDLSPGGSYEVTSPMGAMRTTLAAMEDSLVQLRTVVAQKAEVPTEAQAEGMKVDLDVTGGFDVAAGRLVRIEGTQTIDQSMGGMGGTKIRSSFALQRL